MRILWIPHATWLKKGRQRNQYLIERLKNRHGIHILAWTEPKGPRLRYFLNPLVHLKALKEWTKKEDGVWFHHFRRFCLSRFDFFRMLNESFFQRKIREIVDEYGIEVIIYGPNYYLHGFPPFDLDIPLLFDYSDYVNDAEVRDTYLKKSAAVLCVSKVLHEDAKKYNNNCFYLPNGIDTEKFKNTDTLKVRKKYGLEKNKLISLIGITCSKSLYFLDAFPLIKKKVPDIKFLIVGDSYLLPEMKRRVKSYKEDVIFTGWVDYNEIPDYFAATDVGTYPVDENIYFDSACPIKILEYTATKKPVVSTNLAELRNLKFSNIIFAESNAKDFADMVISALINSFEYPDLTDYDWKNLAEELERILNQINV